MVWVRRSEGKYTGKILLWFFLSRDRERRDLTAISWFFRGWGRWGAGGRLLYIYSYFVTMHAAHSVKVQVGLRGC